MVRRIITILFSVILTAGVVQGEELRPATASAFDRYGTAQETRMADEIASGRFLYMDGLPQRDKDDMQRRLKAGDVVTKCLVPDGNPISVPGGLIHHWLGIVFIPGVSLDRTISFLQDHNQQAQFYSPDVQQSRLVKRDGNNFRVFLRLRKSKVITVILNTDYDVSYSELDANRATSRSISTRIAEVENAGTANESEKPVGNDSGFLWRLNSYWRFWQKDGGTYVQLEAVSLTRDIPGGLNWLVEPFIRSIPQESLDFTLERTRDALMRK